MRSLLEYTTACRILFHVVSSFNEVIVNLLHKPAGEPEGDSLDPALARGRT